MSFDEGLFGWVCEALDPLGTVTMRKMMGGATLYLDGTIFAILDGEEIWFKADDETNAVWDTAGCERFSVTFKDGKLDTMNYRRAPTEVYDDPDEMHTGHGSLWKPAVAPPPKRSRGALKRLSEQNAPRRRGTSG